MRLGGGQLALIELFGDAVGVQEALALARLLGAHTRPALFIVEGDPGLRSQHLDGLGERQVVHLLYEGDDVAALTAAKTMEHAQVRAHVKGRRALVVEGTQALEGADARGSQRYMFADDLVDLHCVTYRFDVVLANQTRHAPQFTDARPRLRPITLTAARTACRTSGRAMRRPTRR